MDFPPPTRVAGLRLNPEKVAAFTLSVAVFVMPNVAEITEEVLAATGVVVMVKVAEVLPPATVTVARTCAADRLLLCSVTTTPLAGAVPLSVTVPVEFEPPRTVAGLSVSEESVGGLTVNITVLVVP